MKKFIAGSALYLVPALAFAQFGNIQGLLTSALTIINTVLLPLIVAIALVFFFWGLARFILAAGDEEAKERGKRLMIWGIIAFFVIVAVWGIVNFLVNAFGFNLAAPNVPEINN